MKHTVSFPGDFMKPNSAEAKAFYADTRQTSINLMMKSYNTTKKQAAQIYDSFFAHVNQDNDYMCLSIEFTNNTDTNDFYAVVFLFLDENAQEGFHGFSFEMPSPEEMKMSLEM